MGLAASALREAPLCASSCAVAVKPASRGISGIPEVEPPGDAGSSIRIPTAPLVGSTDGDTFCHDDVLDDGGAGDCAAAALSRRSASFSTVGDHVDEAGGDGVVFLICSVFSTSFSSLSMSWRSTMACRALATAGSSFVGVEKHEVHLVEVGPLMPCLPQKYL